MRISCCVPFCKRTTNHLEDREWICLVHWRLIDHDKRQVWGRFARHRTSARTGPKDFPCDDKVVTRADRIWLRIKRQAIERGAGP